MAVVLLAIAASKSRGGRRGAGRARGAGIDTFGMLIGVAAAAAQPVAPNRTGAVATDERG
jgi:hypothetical protein